jgi:hypothetical protein
MRLIIATNSAVSPMSAKNALTAFLEAKGWSVWHWYQDLWLIDSSKEINLPNLRDEIQRTIPSLTQVLVLTTEGPISHAGTVPEGSVGWLQAHWARVVSG